MNNLKDEQAWLRTGSLIMLATVALGAALMYTSTVMVPFVLAMFIYVSICPLLDFLVLRCKLPRLIAATMTFVVVLGVVALFATLVAGSAQQMIQSAGLHQQELEDQTSQGFDVINGSLSNWGIPPVGKMLEERWGQAFETVGGMVVKLITSSFLVVIFVIFLLAGRRPEKSYAPVYREIHAQVRKYIVIKTATCAATGTLVWLVLDYIGLELAPLFGLIAFVLNFIPTVGALAATLLPLPVALAQFGGDPWLVVSVVAIPGAIQLLIGNLLEPKLLGQGLELHPATIILSLAFWYLLWGPVGMILAAPMTAALRIVCMQFETTWPAAELLSGRLPLGSTRRAFPGGY